ncbi:BQ2448_4541 [Microbotryum intermedium]|uniref:BQ2448_4541 protein n=1 Tax=Microbotryum intermedium TaxID=269621 RepID=A0A238FF44_9BASI|nr:BQ2448_4541 [Microbotryum intermedium]
MGFLDSKHKCGSSRPIFYPSLSLTVVHPRSEIPFPEAVTFQDDRIGFVYRSLEITSQSTLGHGGSSTIQLLFRTTAALGASITTVTTIVQTNHERYMDALVALNPSEATAASQYLPSYCLLYAKPAKPMKKEGPHPFCQQELSKSILGSHPHETPTKSSLFICHSVVHGQGSYDTAFTLAQTWCKNGTKVSFRKSWPGPRRYEVDLLRWGDYISGRVLSCLRAANPLMQRRFVS